MIDFLHTNHVFVGKHIQYIIFPWVMRQVIMYKLFH